MSDGLSSIQSAELLSKNGPNEIPEKKVSLIRQLLVNILSPISLMLVLAAALSFVVGKIFDGYFILILLFVNTVIILWQENKADQAIRTLNTHLDQQIQVCRDGQWTAISSRLLVAGDVIRLSAGEIVPADGVLIRAQHVSVNESALTGESLPLDKSVHDSLFAGAFIASGIAIVEVTATGGRTRFGKTLLSVDRERKQSLLEKDILSITRFLTGLSLVTVCILTGIFLIRQNSLLELMTLDLSLIIAGIPISLPTVMTLIIEVGVLHLAQKRVIIRRLSALEDLANVTYLLTDKTGTLTENNISVQKIFPYHPFTVQDVLLHSAKIASLEETNPINQTILKKAFSEGLSVPGGTVEEFTPADSDRKRSTLHVVLQQGRQTISLGAPQVIIKACKKEDQLSVQFDQDVESLAKDGYRTLALALSQTGSETEMDLVGLLALSDTLRADAQSVVAFLRENGITVTMVTGDNRAIASHIAKQLALDEGTVMAKDQLDKQPWQTLSKAIFERTGAFAEILPEDKFHLVKRAKDFFVVAADGDGINDLPAVKAANVGIAVRNAVPALKASADIVLLGEGLSVIKDAIIESRKIFARIYTYSLYRISESFRLIITIAILGLIYGQFPMTPLQIILIALLNDIPIISLAFDRVNITHRPEKINAKARFMLSSFYGLVGVANSIILFLLVQYVWHLPWEVIQTMFFLKLTVSGHLLIFVAHTPRRWYTFLPSRDVIIATVITQGVATVLAASGFFMPTHISFSLIIFIWIWAVFWMQISELMKLLQNYIQGTVYA